MAPRFNREGTKLQIFIGVQPGKIIPYDSYILAFFSSKSPGKTFKSGEKTCRTATRNTKVKLKLQSLFRNRPFFFYRTLKVLPFIKPQNPPSSRKDQGGMEFVRSPPTKSHTCGQVVGQLATTVDGAAGLGVVFFFLVG